MSREPFDQRVIEEFERDLRDALAIEPSPDFARQVRARIAARRSTVVWWRFALPLAAMCVLAVGLGMWMNHSSEVVQVRAKPAADVRLRPDVAVRAAVHTPHVIARNIKVQPNTAPMPEPEIIVAPDRAEALARFLELARGGALNEQMLPANAANTPPLTLEISPLIVRPIPVAEIENQGATAHVGADQE